MADKFSPALMSPGGSTPGVERGYPTAHRLDADAGFSRCNGVG
jgi:hypothetical protein